VAGKLPFFLKIKKEHSIPSTSRSPDLQISKPKMDYCRDLAASSQVRGFAAAGLAEKQRATKSSLNDTPARHATGYLESSCLQVIQQRCLGQPALGRFQRVPTAPLSNVFPNRLGKTVEKALLDQLKAS
jgi:hypothetical protein